MTESANTYRPSESEMKDAQIEVLIPAIRKSFITSVVSIAIFGAILISKSPAGLALWVGVRAGASIASLIMLRRVTKPALDPDQTAKRLAVIMAASGIVWGIIPLLIRPAEPEWRAIVVFWLFGNQSVATAVCSPSRPVFQAATGSVTLVGAASVLLYGDSFSLVLATILLLGGAYSMSIFGAMHQSVNSAIEGRLVAAAMASSLATQQAELKTANAALTQLANRDELTSLLNRRSFKTLVADGNLRLIGNGWLAYVDLDHFKTTNDTYGHAAGDQVLQVAAERWRAILPIDSVLARTGGDEFSCWFGDVSVDEAHELAQNLNSCLTKPIAVAEGPDVQVSCSVGVTQARAGEAFADAAARADDLLYRVKERGRDGVEVTTIDLPVEPGEVNPSAPTRA